MKERRNKRLKNINYKTENFDNSIFIILIIIIIGFFMLQLNLIFTGLVIFEPVSDFNLNEDFDNLELNLSDNVTNAEPDSEINYTVTLTDNNVVTAVFDLINGTGNLTFYSIANQSGSTNINVTAYNTTGFQNSTFFTLTISEVNDAPSVPNLHLPLNNSFHLTIPEFDWSNSTDIENNETNYTIEISDNITFSYTNFSNSTIIEIINTTKEVSVSNLDDSEYYWRVLATDSVDNSSFSETRTFTIDTIVPTEFNLTSPENTTNSTDSTPALAWEETTDINFDNYTIEFSNETDFSIINFTFYEVNTVSNNTFSNWNSTEALENTTWYWRVTAYDKAGNSVQSNVFTYIVGTQFVTVQKDAIRVQEAGVAKTRGPRKLQQISLDILQPSPISLFTNETIITPIFITNTGDTTLRSISLATLVNASYLDAQLSQENINLLFPGQTLAIDLLIRSTPETLAAQHEVTIEAKVIDPNFKDSIKFFIDILEFGFGETRTVREKIEVINKLFDANPDCAELMSLVDKAEAELKKKNFDNALLLVEVAIQSCKDLVSSLGKELVIEPTKRDFYISIIETVLAIILFMFIYRYYKRRQIMRKLKKVK